MTKMRSKSRVPPPLPLYRVCGLVRRANADSRWAAKVRVGELHDSGRHRCREQHCLAVLVLVLNVLEQKVCILSLVCTRKKAHSAEGMRETNCVCVRARV